MTTKELYNHFNKNVYPKLSWGTDLTMIKILNKVRSEINVVSERPGPRRTTLRTFEYKDYRYVETINTAAGDRGNICHIPTGELIGTDATYFDFNTFVWWVYNYR